LVPALQILLHYGWWIDRKGHNLFEVGFLGLDNISPFNRSEPLPPGFSLKQAEATGWTALIVNLVSRRYRRDIPEYWKASRRAQA